MIKTIKEHLANWPEFYLAIPLAIITAPTAGLFVYFLSGRQPIESLGWMIDISQRIQQAALAILFVSLCRQAFGHWLTKDEYLAHPVLGTIQSIFAFSGLCVLLYFFSH